MSSTESATLELGDSFARAFPELGVEWSPAAVPAPELVVFNDALAAELGLDRDALTAPAGVALLAGNAVSPGSAPIAMGYAGHQFGSFSGRLGDGRALLLGELSDPTGQPRDLHLKGSGRTPYARGGDGKAALGPMLREYLMAEALHALGIRTARALSVVATGEQIQREELLPGAVLARVADSHIRVGTFELAVRLGDIDALRRLADHAIERHHPAAADRGPGRYLALLEAVTEAQAELVAGWMLVGFVHGVLNTDNVTISGETIDYGPCAFMDRHDPATVFSSIDHGGRYAYGNQPAITQWNLARFAEALLPLIDMDPGADSDPGGDPDAPSNRAIEQATEVLASFSDRYGRHWLAGMGRKLGLVAEPVHGAPSDDRVPDDGVPDDEAVDGGALDEALADDLLVLLTEHRVDHTGAFRALAAELRGDRGPLDDLVGEDLAGEDPVGPATGFDDWLRRWRSRLEAAGRPLPEVADEMDRVNPLYVPRNHLVEEALAAATAGDGAPFDELFDVVTHPFTERADQARYAEPAPDSFTAGYQTFCGT